MKTKKFKGDWYSKYLRQHVKHNKAEFRRQHKASFTDRSSDSYDDAQRYGAAWTAFEVALGAYLEFKTRGEK